MKQYSHAHKRLTATVSPCHVLHSLYSRSYFCPLLTADINLIDSEDFPDLNMWTLQSTIGMVFISICELFIWNF
jgi:hypothetical protein